MRRSVVRSEVPLRFGKSKASPSGGSWLRRAAEQTDEGLQAETRRISKAFGLLLFRPLRGHLPLKGKALGPAPHYERLPLEGKLSPKVTDEEEGCTF